MMNLQFSLANVLSLCVLTALTMNAVWMSVLVYREARVLAYLQKNVEDGLRRLKSHCRVIGVSVVMIFALGVAVGSDMVATCLTEFQRTPTDQAVIRHVMAGR